MTAPLKTIEGRDIAEAMRAIGARAKAAARTLALAPSAQKDASLAAMADAIRARTQKILAANSEDLADARAGGATEAFLDRLALDAKRIEAMAASVELVRQLPDPVGTLTEAWTRPNGMRIERVRVPLGVVGVIFESRPNVTADAGALCLKAGNAVILRGGSGGRAGGRGRTGDREGRGARRGAGGGGRRARRRGRGGGGGARRGAGRPAPTGAPARPPPPPGDRRRG